MPEAAVPPPTLACRDFFIRELRRRQHKAEATCTYSVIQCAKARFKNEALCSGDGFYKKTAIIIL